MGAPLQRLTAPRAARRWFARVALMAALALLGPAAGCRRRGAASPPLEPPVATVFAPAGLAPGQRRPLLVFLHGYGGSGQEAFDHLELRALGARQGLFVVAPDGTLDRRGRRFWNAGAACCDFDRSGIDDVGRLAALIERWRARPDVDGRRLYVAGFSNGGFMAHRLACALGDRLAAVASFAGAGLDAGGNAADGGAPPVACPVTSPIGILEIHGDRDPVVRYAGGRVFDDPGNAVHPSATDTVAAWADRLGCAPPAGPGQERTGAALVVERRACRLGSVELWTVPGAGHGVASPELMEQAWLFLARHVKPSP